MHVYIFLIIEEKRGQKREKLEIQEQSLRSQMNQKETIMTQSNAILIENLPQNYN